MYPEDEDQDLVRRAGPAPYTPESKRELLELQAVIFLDAPNQFSVLPNEEPGESRTLKSTVLEMRRGVERIYRQPRHQNARTQMHDLVSRMYVEFKSGQILEGRETSLEFRDLLTRSRP